MANGPAAAPGGGPGPPSPSLPAVSDADTACPPAQPRPDLEPEPGGEAAACAPASPDAVVTAVGSGLMPDEAGAQRAGPPPPPLQQPAVAVAAGAEGVAAPPLPTTDPDYEVPQGALTETQVLLAAAEQRPAPLRLDPYGFILPDADPPPQPPRTAANGGGGGADDGDARRASGAAAGTSGAGSGGASSAEAAIQQQLSRVRKWRKMLGPSGADLAAYRARRPAKLKQRIRKGVPEQLRGLAWHVLSGGRDLLLSNPAGTFGRLAATPPPSSGFLQAPSLLYVQLACPWVLLGDSGLARDPACTTPPMTLASGAEAEALLAEGGLVTGDSVRVRLALGPGGAAGGIPAAPKVLQLQLLRAAQPKCPQCIEGGPGAGRPGAAVRAVVYLLELCGKKSTWRTPQEFEKVLFTDAAAGTGAASSVQAMYETCSYGASSFKPDNVVVLGPLELPCKQEALAVGNASVAADLAAGCGAGELAALQQMAEAYAMQAAQADPGGKLAGVLAWPIQRRALFVLPPDSLPACPWNALGELGCRGPLCASFFRGAVAAQPAVLFHELQHNEGAVHAGRGADPYGDPTSPMGDLSALTGANARRLLCHNAPLGYRAGWASPINIVPGVGYGQYGNLTAGNFSGAELLLTLPAAGSRPDHIVVINLGARGPEGAVAVPVSPAATPRPPVLFLSFRVRGNATSACDSGLPKEYDRKVHVHAYGGAWAPRELVGGSGLVGVVAAGGAWRGPFFAMEAGSRVGGGLVVRVVSAGAASARVSLCRATATSETAGGVEGCYDGYDNDCDGLTDAEDPDCL
ncbi:Autolysin [Tetrabaena socialis]|uniref:Autolysin n=1 Tax=Tetrabaena socialis TaxID=47790 RepID=A0A2J8A4V8_9CHLO|nr:Autolysin [Tetrabaena socialis]|eukprot:PNH07551.1 Autolysin [Tetrabaena socialis]